MSQEIEKLLIDQELEIDYLEEKLKEKTKALKDLQAQFDDYKWKVFGWIFARLPLGKAVDPQIFEFLEIPVEDSKNFKKNLTEMIQKIKENTDNDDSSSN